MTSSESGQQGRTLLITNDFPPRSGGIQTFVYGLIRRQPPDSVVVLAPRAAESEAFDAEQDFQIIRHSGPLILPDYLVCRKARSIVRAEQCDRVLFGASVPLGMLARPLRRHGVERVVGITHGLEAALSSTPGARLMMRNMASSIDTLTYLGSYTRSRIAAAAGQDAAQRMRRLVPGVDHERFNPGNREQGLQLKRELGLEGRPVIVCVSRLIPRKGQDSLINALPVIRAQVPDAALLIVGGGSYRGELEKLVASTGQSRDVVITGPVPGGELPYYYAAGDVFAMPCRTRNRGWDVEGLGIVYLEASATGLPVVAGQSGGASDAVIDGHTGYVIDGRSINNIADRIVELLNDPKLATRMGVSGRKWIETDWSWSNASNRLAMLLAGQDPDASVV